MNKVAAQVGNAAISSRCMSVPEDMLGSDKLQRIIENMRSVNNEMNGVGISANQIGEPLRISLIHVKATTARPELKDSGELLMINPNIVTVSENAVNEWEGCLSVAEAGIFAQVSRPESLTVEWLDETGASHNADFDGFTARVIQHELAHLEGRVFLQEPGVDLSTLHSRSEYVAKKSSGDL